MSMHLVGPYLTTTKYGRKSKKSKSVKLAAATEAHEKWLRDRGLHPEQRALQKAYRGRHSNPIPDYHTDRSMLSNGIGNGFVKGVMANLHNEKPEVQRAIMEKAARTTVAYNKGPTMYFSPDSDTTNLGSRSRRG